MNKKEVLELLNQLKIKPLKSLGQNFLIQDDVCKKIVSSFEVSDFDQFIEIGPGLGSLTRLLIEKVGSEKFQLIELDRTLAQYWKDQGLQVHHLDALKFPWSELKQKTLVVSNLPYQISSRILVEFFKSDAPIDQMLFMFQKEVGQRIFSGPEDKKQYGLISIICQLKWDIKKVIDVNKRCFFPVPDVESQVLSFKRKLDQEDCRWDLFVDHLKVLFSKRRKKIKQSYAGLGEEGEMRPDQLTAEQHLELFKVLTEKGFIEKNGRA